MSFLKKIITHFYLTNFTHMHSATHPFLDSFNRLMMVYLSFSITPSPTHTPTTL